MELTIEQELSKVLKEHEETLQRAAEFKAEWLRLKGFRKSENSPERADEHHARSLYNAAIEDSLDLRRKIDLLRSTVDNTKSIFSPGEKPLDSMQKKLIQQGRLKPMSKPLRKW